MADAIKKGAEAVKDKASGKRVYVHRNRELVQIDFCRS